MGREQERIECVREIALRFGYAIGVHGSLGRDVDLIAVPWTEGAAGTDSLVAALVAELPAYVPDEYRRVERPHGRLGYILHTAAKPWIDLSVVPTAAESDWRRRAMCDAKDALACGNGDAAWEALNRHECRPTREQPQVSGIRRLSSGYWTATVEAWEGDRIVFSQTESSFHDEQEANDWADFMVEFLTSEDGASNPTQGEEG